MSLRFALAAAGRPAARALRPVRLAPPLLLLLLAQGFTAPAAHAQYTIEAPSGLELQVGSSRVRVMLDTTRTLEQSLQEDPRILYFTIVGEEVPDGEEAVAAYPWNAVEVRTDSIATILTPGNLREADRAYYNYAVTLMRLVREEDPDVGCDELMAREVEAVSAFSDGWLVSRVLFGALPYTPLDEIVFARESELLPGMLAYHGDRQLGACAEAWAAEHAEELDAYLEWRETRFLTLVEPPAEALDSAAVSEG